MVMIMVRKKIVFRVGGKIQNLKEKVVIETLKEKDDCLEEIPWDIYIATARKVLAQNKHMFCGYIKSGPKFEVGVYYILNRIYKEKVSQS